MKQDSDVPAKKTAPPHYGMSFGDRVTLWYEQNGKLVNVMLVIILLGVCAWQLMKRAEGNRIAGANAEYNQTRKAQQESLSIRESATQKDKLGGVVTSAETLAKEYPEEYIGRRAHLIAGNAYYRQASLEEGKPMVDLLDKAIGSYQQALNVATNNEERASALLAIGNAKEDKMFQNPGPLNKEVEEAYKEAATLGAGTYLEGAAKLALARIKQVVPGQSAEAEALYKEVIEDRKLEVADGSGEVKTASGDLLTSEQLSEIRMRSDLSYEGIAKRNLQRLPTVPKQ